ncbi:protein SENSITIVE TO UV 2 [Gastrolobium bilobum]|uniref:protein SENSITIVE TO UV 2 n=1 Tax=Gastrolobium bilobum TaxID=150636 RepID=UPI002AAFD41A|nr:protein SENSITIVE TO UV 2 [Gastrolobium bilobum]
MMNNKSEDRFSDDDVWEDAMLEELIKTEELVLSSKAKPPSNPSLSHPPPLPAISYVPQQPLRSVAVSTCDAAGFSPPRELSQRTTLFDSLHHSPSRPPKPDSDKDLEISRLKRELGRATKQIANLEKECLKFQNEEKSGRIKCSESIHKDSEILALDYDKIPSKFPNGVSSNNLAVETTFKAIGIQTDMVNHQEAQGCICDDLPDYSDLSQKLVAVWGSPTDKKLGTNAISKLLVGCQRDFHILFGCMSMSLPSEITRELLTDISSSGVALHYLKDCFHTTEAEKVSHLYLALTKIADGTYVLETLIEPLLDLCGMENVVIVRSSLCILHTLLKLLMELEKNFGRRDNVFIEGLCDGKDLMDSGRLEDVKDGTLLRDNVFIEGLCDGKDLMDSGRLEDVKDGKFFNKEMLSRKECWNHQNALQPHVNWLYLFEIMHQIAMRITEESVRVEAATIMKLVLLRSNAYFEREQFSQKIVFKTISELLKKDAGLRVKKHALRLLYLVLNCPKLLATFCCGCKEGDDSSAMDDSASASDFQNFKIILQGLADCVASNGGGLQELKISRDAILVLAFLASSGQPGFEILVGHRLPRGVNYLMLILQLLVSEMDLEAGAPEEQPEIFRERTFLTREILILLNRLVSSPSYSATVLRGLTSTRDMAGLSIDVASRLSRKGKKNEQQDNVVKHIRETEIVDLARLFKKRVFTYLGDDLL